MLPWFAADAPLPDAPPPGMLVRLAFMSGTVFVKVGVTLEGPFVVTTISVLFGLAVTLRGCEKKAEEFGDPVPEPVVEQGEPQGDPLSPEDEGEMGEVTRGGPGRALITGLCFWPPPFDALNPDMSSSWSESMLSCLLLLLILLLQTLAAPLPDPKTKFSTTPDPSGGTLCLATAIPWLLAPLSTPSCTWWLLLGDTLL